MYKDKAYLYKEFITKRKTVKEIAKDCNISASSVEHYLKRYGIKRGNIKHTIDLSKVTVLNPIFCYYSGLVITDGYFDKKVNRVAIRVRNEGSYKVLNLIKDYLNYTGNVKVYREVDNELNITSKELIQELEKLGCSKLSKPYNKFPLETLNTLDNSCVSMFLRGVLDGDGNIKRNKNYSTFRITLSNKSFLDDMSLFLNNYLGLSTKVVQDRKYFKIEMSKADSETFLDFIYFGFEEYKFPKKYEAYARKMKI